jgi:uncharacterized FlgJ-related protein
MRDALSVLQRIRNHRKKGAENAFSKAERARQDQEALVKTMAESVEKSRQEADAEDEACWVAQAQAWRLKMEVQIRREEAHLADRVEEVQDRRQILTRANRDHRVVEIALENIDERQATQRKKAETRRLDAMGTTRWRRKEG